jgi:hypothetical protein
MLNPFLSNKMMKILFVNNIFHIKGIRMEYARSLLVLQYNNQFFIILPIRTLCFKELSICSMKPTIYCCLVLRLRMCATLSAHILYALIAWWLGTWTTLPFHHFTIFFPQIPTVYFSLSGSANSALLHVKLDL